MKELALLKKHKAHGGVHGERAQERQSGRVGKACSLSSSVGHVRSLDFIPKCTGTALKGFKIGHDII